MTNASLTPKSLLDRTVLTCTGVSKSYGSAKAVRDVDLSLHGGEVLSIVGPSGCGKSTLLRAVAGLIAIDDGTIELGGHEVSGPRTFVPAEQRRVGIVFQDLALFPHLTVADNMAFGLRFGPDATSNGRARSARVEQMLAMVGLDDKAGRYPHELSGGEQQRVAIGRALALDPALVLLDEPFSQLDRGLAASVRAEAMATLRSAETSVILVTHDQEEALAVADRVAVMHHGALLQVDTPAGVYHYPSTEHAAAMLGPADFLIGEHRDGVAHTAIGPVRIGAGHGDRVKVLLRPHHLVAERRTPEPGGAKAPGIGAPAVVEHTEFRGRDVLHLLRLSTGEVVRAMIAHDQALRPGEAALVHLPDAVELVAFDQ